MSFSYAARLPGSRTRHPLSRPASARLFWGLLVVSALLVLADASISWAAFLQVASRHVALWRDEWNPLSGWVLRTYGLLGMVAEQAMIIALTWLLMGLSWYVLPNGDLDLQVIVRRMVLFTLLAACLLRAGVVGWDLSHFPVLPPGQHAPGGSTAPTSATSQPTTTATSTPIPQPTTTASPQPTATPRPRRTPTPTPCPKHDCGG